MNRSVPRLTDRAVEAGFGMSILSIGPVFLVVQETSVLGFSLSATPSVPPVYR